VNFVKNSDEHFVFHLGKREKGLLLDVLKLYPLIPISHHRIGHGPDSPAQQANQKLLEEALTEHRNENKRSLDAMVSEPNRFQETPTGYRLVLSSSQLEWMLQVLNDVRVGSWLQLGSPDEQQGKRLKLGLQNARYLWAMEISGHFQHALMMARDS
jgi:hypothetical protein